MGQLEIGDNMDHFDIVGDNMGHFEIGDKIFHLEIGDNMGLLVAGLCYHVHTPEIVDHMGAHTPATGDDVGHLLSFFCFFLAI